MDRIDAHPLAPASAARLDRLFRRYHQRLTALAVTRTRSVADAEDVAAETWVRAAHCLAQLQADDDHAYPWLRAIAVRAAIDLYRPRRASEDPRDWSDTLASRVLPPVPPADDGLYVLADLTHDEARAYALAAQGLGWTAIGRCLAWHPTTVRRRLASGARTLRAAALAG
jgi:DNA-directed RNA polymerase specialized sigma24 family protein